jgi:hypothetical protein
MRDKLREKAMTWSRVAWMVKVGWRRLEASLQNLKKTFQKNPFKLPSKNMREKAMTWSRVAWMEKVGWRRLVEASLQPPHQLPNSHSLSSLKIPHTRNINSL